MAATTSKTHPRKAGFAACVGRIIRRRHPPDVAAVVAYLQKSNAGMSREEAELKARSRSWSRNIRTFSPPAAEVERELVALVKNHRKLDEAGLRKTPPELPLLLPNARNGPTGAEAALAKMIACLRKGCAQDPLPVEDM